MERSEGRYNWLKNPKNHNAFFKIMKKNMKDEKKRFQNMPMLKKSDYKLIKHMIIERICGYCREFKSSLRGCVNCENIYYCSEEHQKLHWKKHKIECRKHNVTKTAVIKNETET